MLQTSLARLGAALGLTLALASPAAASSMPKADFNRPSFGLGFGNGLSLALDFPLSRDFSLGGSLNATYFYTRSSSFDLRGLYKLMHGGPLSLDLLGGVAAYSYGTYNFNTLEPFIGVALAYPFTSQLIGRLNVAVGVFGRGYYGPSGLELAYKFTPTLEGTIGANGRGDVLGLRLSF